MTSLDLLPGELRGLQAFVCTPFNLNGELNLPRFKSHLRYLLDFPQRPAGMFVGCGTGELWSLDLAEHIALVRAAVDVVEGEVPVVAGVGYGTRMARTMALAAQDAGADAVLVFPPYLASGPQEGLLAHYRAIAEAVSIGVIVYHRDNAVLSPETAVALAAVPNVVGLKDGYGDLLLLDEIRAQVGSHWVYGNGMPVAETYAPMFFTHGVRSYSPGIIDFLPEVAWVFDDALEREDQIATEKLLGGFYRPLAELRKRAAGSGTSVVKAGLKLRGMPVGSVRPPLVDMCDNLEGELGHLIEHGLALASSLTAPAGKGKSGGAS